MSTSVHYDEVLDAFRVIAESISRQLDSASRDPVRSIPLFLRVGYHASDEMKAQLAQLITEQFSWHPFFARAEVTDSTCNGRVGVDVTIYTQYSLE